MSYLASDAAFDALYPEEIQRASRRFWTPVETARRAAVLLRDAGATRVLDVGSGAGKFALVAAATAPAMRVLGVEQRGHLVELARRAKVTLGVTNVDFTHGNASEVSWKGYDAFYFYNSFAENLFDVFERLDDKAELSVTRFARDVQRAYANLRAAPEGTLLATYYGSSGRVPSSFELTHVEAADGGWLRLWTKKTMTDDGAFFVEVAGAIESHAGSGARLPAKPSQ
jgi:protein-L-isoaspartate O-methyltransferase